MQSTANDSKRQQTNPTAKKREKRLRIFLRIHPRAWQSPHPAPGGGKPALRDAEKSGGSLQLPQRNASETRAPSANLSQGELQAPPTLHTRVKVATQPRGAAHGAVANLARSTGRARSPSAPCGRVATFASVWRASRKHTRMHIATLPRGALGERALPELRANTHAPQSPPFHQPPATKKLETNI